MKNFYKSELDYARVLKNDAEILSYATAILRSLLQSLALTSLETAFQHTSARDEYASATELTQRFGQPSDGLPIETLDFAIPVLRSFVAKNFMTGWFEPNNYSVSALVVELQRWVEFRNKRQGHGVLDQHETKEWANRTTDIISTLLDSFSEFLPFLNENGILSATTSGTSTPITTPLLINGNPIVITKIYSRKGVWKLSAQTLSWENSIDITVDLPSQSIFCIESNFSEKFKLTEMPGRASSIFNNVPVRQTTNFVGRKKELEKLHAWLADVPDSRSCLIYGDGGFGKTTLALEFVNGILDDAFEDIKLIPSIICYYTAKKTKWTDDGLVHFKGISDAMEDSIRELLYFFYPVLGKEWYIITGNPLIDKVVGEFQAQGFTRDDILLVIDNTETLTTSAHEAEELAEFMTRVSKRLGRVIITSRRWELLAATPVAVSSLSIEEACTLIRRLGDEYKAVAVSQAGDARLRDTCTKLMCKPLLIDTFVRYVARSAVGIQDGLDQILKKTSDELLEFLYEDAWARMNSLVKEVFIVIVSLANPVDGRCVGDVCKEIGVQHSEFQASLDETYFASIVDHGETYDLEIVELAKEFFRKKKSKASPSDTARFDNIAFKVDKLATERFEIDRHYKLDRVADGFRSQYAKAAKISYIKRDYKGARENFELALLDEPLNASLRERYASFLFRTLGKPHQALEYAQQAKDLDPSNADAWLTLALIQYKLDNMAEGDICIGKAMKHGKPESLCILRKAIARYHSAASESNIKTARIYLQDVDALLIRAKRVSDQKDFYFQKNMRTADKYEALANTLRAKLNQSRPKQEVR